jgi:hypothetical protein
MQDCPTCNGTGQVLKDGKQSDCPTCDGEGQLKAAAATLDTSNGGQPVKEISMLKKDAIATLTACPCSGFTTADAPFLETLSEARLDEHVATGIARKKVEDDLKVATAKVAELEPELKAAKVAQIPAEELMQLRTLAEERKQQQVAEKVVLVEKLVPLKALTKEQLEAKSLDDLKTLAAFAKVEVTDYSVRGIPVSRSAESDVYANPPNPFSEEALAKFRAAHVQ